MKLSDKLTASLGVPAGKSEAIHFDDKLAGFGIRIRAGGSKVWIFQYRAGTKQRRMTLGSVGSMTAGRARSIAEDLDAKVHLGEDPASDKVEAHARANETFEMAMLGFLKHQRQRLKPRSMAEVERHMRINAKPLHAAELANIDRRMVAAQLNRLATNNGPVTTNRARTVWSAFFNWCAREGLIDTNPAAYTNKQPEASRERVLSEDELRAVWTALPDNDYGDAVKLLALTGQRRAEIGDLRWSEIDFERNLITLPAARTKNGREHVVPMSAPVRAILEARPRYAGRDLVFGSRGEGGFSGWARGFASLKVALTPAWTIHDLRRTAATRMAGEPLSIQPHIIEAVLNHVSGHKSGVAGIYNRAQYLAEKRQALALWGDYLVALVEGRASNVLAMPARA